MKLTDKEIAAIEQTLNKGCRTELIPTKEGIKLIKIQRNQIKTK